MSMSYDQVADEVYKVPRRPFMGNPHPPFSDLISLPTSEKDGEEGLQEPEGSSEDSPIVLEQVEKAEFESFLSVLLVNPPFQATKLFQSFKIEEWISVLKLATQWNFFALRKLSIHYLSSNKGFKYIDRIVFARKYSVPRWFVEGIATAAFAFDSQISHSDAERLGLSTTVSLYHLKGVVRGHARRHGLRSNISSLSTKLFSAELLDMNMNDGFETVGDDKQLKELHDALPATNSGEKGSPNTWALSLDIPGHNVRSCACTVDAETNDFTISDIVSIPHSESSSSLPVRYVL
ncbi:hypothetical protein V5O48_008788 [Marasmius crinis-equi]|uniref:Uncharacterized protein n=1 Tax=Marasmius crinis-equi TaxID=585013 RepID=A0ABR3FD26_9AGAR